MKKTRVWLCVGLGVLLFGWTISAQNPGAVIVVNKNNPLASLTRAQVKKLLTGSEAKFPGGGKAVVLTTAPGSPERVSALHDYCGMSEQQLNADMIHASFVGEERTKPRPMGSGKAIVSVVEAEVTALGVVSETDVTDQVKVLKVE